MINEFLLNRFPSLPLYKGYWQSIQLEPIIGSEERITIAICAIGEDLNFRIVPTLSDDVLSFLYLNNKKNISDIINITIKSMTNYVIKNRSLNNWISPFSGIYLSTLHKALDIDIDGIIEQGIRFSSSLSTLLSSSFDRNNNKVEKKRKIINFSNSIQEIVINEKPSLAVSFNQKIRIINNEAMTSFGFLNDRYAFNFGLLTPNNLSGSLTNIKARIFDIEALKKSELLIKPERYEVIIGSPSLLDPTLSDKTISRMKDSFDMVEEIADKEDICLYQVNNSQTAAERIIKLAA